MVKIIKRWKLAAEFGVLRGSTPLTKLKYFWRKGWAEIPAVMASSFLGVAGICMIAHALYYNETHDMTPKYYKTPRIYRPDDPKVQKIRHVSAYD